MSVTHPDTVRNGMADYVVDRLDAGAGAGQLVLQAADNSVVATLTFADPAFGSATGGVATANPITSATGVPGGTATKFKATDSEGVICFSGTVGTSGTDIVLTNNVIGGGETVAVDSLTYTAPL